MSQGDRSGSPAPAAAPGPGPGPSLDDIGAARRRAQEGQGLLGLMMARGRSPLPADPEASDHAEPAPGEREVPATRAPMIATGRAAPRRGREVKDAYEAFSAAAGRSQAEPPSSGQGISEEGDDALAAARARGLAAWAQRLGAAFSAKATGPPGDPEASYNPPDPAGYADGKIHSGSSSGGGGSSRAKEPSGKEIKDAQYLKTAQDPISGIQHIYGNNINWDRNKDREAPKETTEFDNPIFFENEARNIRARIVGERLPGESHTADLPEGTNPITGPWHYHAETLKDKFDKGVGMEKGGLSSAAAKAGDSVVGALEHLSDSATELGHKINNVLTSGLNDHMSADERLADQHRKQEEREERLEQDPHPGAISGAVHTRQMERMLQASDPAQSRETFVDKILYPWSKDASDDTHARELAKKYKDYLKEKEEAGEPYDPLGSMTHDKEYDTSKLPATTQQVERSKVDMDTGERSGNNQRFLVDRAPHAGQAPLPEAAKRSLESLAADTEAHGRPLQAGLQGLAERVAEERERGGQRGELKTRGTASPYNDDEGDAESYRDPQGERAWRAAQVTSDNIKVPSDHQVRDTAQRGTDQAAERLRGAGEAAQEKAGEMADRARGVGEAAQEKAGEVADRARGAGEEARAKADEVTGSVRGAAEAAGGEVRRAAGAVEGAAEVAGEEASRTAGGLLDSLRDGFKALVGADREHRELHQPQTHHEPQRHREEDGERRHEAPSNAPMQPAVPTAASRPYSDAPLAVSQLYSGGGETQPERRQRVDVGEEVTRKGQETAEGVERAGRDAATAAREGARVVEATAEQTAESTKEATGGLLGALRDLFVGPGEEGANRHTRDTADRPHVHAPAPGAKHAPAVSDLSPAGPGEREEARDETLGQAVERALEKLQEADPRDPNLPNAPDVPYTSTQEILEARRAGQQQEAQ
ncbi:hypothetical protein HYH03_004071 [Edaphochlamys debaryana]|uniref:Uncharacterized protein n=1 Tax=Edaphochlamys debaryana TaxID=47281 RepID=A0A836C2F8_9CHLO|nr:hypothetical protein HYH03_004071 [Edaphochlamys debaryana]|eukprot:KAG2497800.1 hypothetical protein HYH03_004071 [Edaphochlamys debaryana]